MFHTCIYTCIIHITVTVYCYCWCALVCACHNRQKEGVRVTYYYRINPLREGVDNSLHCSVVE